jgi:ADP-ribose pyrophosphatase YjhB (NUDIX family)
MDLVTIARELQAISQTGLHFSRDPYDRERYQRLGAMAAEMFGSVSTTSPATLLAWQAEEFGYATPKVDVRGFLIRDDSVLLVQETADAGRWTLPGGWADVNETPAEAVTREVREESGFECRAIRLLAVLDRERNGHLPPFPYHIYKLFFLCEITGGAAQPSAEASDVRFFKADELPELSVSRVTGAQIERFFAKVRAGDPTTDFDQG